jgi:hypothetical protein
MMSTLVKDFNTSNHLLLALRFFQEDDKYEYNHIRKLRVTTKQIRGYGFSTPQILFEITRTK